MLVKYILFSTIAFCFSFAVESMLVEERDRPPVSRTPSSNTSNSSHIPTLNEAHSGFQEVGLRSFPSSLRRGYVISTFERPPAQVPSAEYLESQVHPVSVYNRLQHKFAEAIESLSTPPSGPPPSSGGTPLPTGGGSPSSPPTSSGVLSNVNFSSPTEPDSNVYYLVSRDDGFMDVRVDTHEYKPGFIIFIESTEEGLPHPHTIQRIPTPDTLQELVSQKTTTFIKAGSSLLLFFVGLPNPIWYLKPLAFLFSGESILNLLTRTTEVMTTTVSLLEESPGLMDQIFAKLREIGIEYKGPRFLQDPYSTSEGFEVINDPILPPPFLSLPSAPPMDEDDWQEVELLQ